MTNAILRNTMQPGVIHLQDGRWDRGSLDSSATLSVQVRVLRSLKNLLDSLLFGHVVTIRNDA